MGRPHQAMPTRRELLIHNELFFAEILSRIAEGKRPRLLPRGSSMRPFIRWGAGSDRPLTSHRRLLLVGRIVLARIARGYLVHRIVRIDGGVFTLRGDGNPYQREQCTHEEILAEVTAVHRGKRVIEVGDNLWWRYENLWPENDTLRRIALALYRRTLLRWGW